MEAAAPQPGDHNRRRLCWTKHFPKTGFSERVPILGLCRTSASRTSSSAARSRAANHLRPGDTETLAFDKGELTINTYDPNED